MFVKKYICILKLLIIYSVFTPVLHLFQSSTYFKIQPFSSLIRISGTQIGCALFRSSYSNSLANYNQTLKHLTFPFFSNFFFLHKNLAK